MDENIVKILNSPAPWATLAALGAWLVRGRVDAKRHQRECRHAYVKAWREMIVLVKNNLHHGAGKDVSMLHSLNSNIHWQAFRSHLTKEEVRSLEALKEKLPEKDYWESAQILLDKMGDIVNRIEKEWKLV